MNRHSISWRLRIQFYVLNSFSIKTSISSSVHESIDISWSERDITLKLTPKIVLIVTFHLRLLIIIFHLGLIRPNRINWREQIGLLCCYILYQLQLPCFRALIYTSSFDPGNRNPSSRKTYVLSEALDCTRPVKDVRLQASPLQHELPD